MVKKLPPTFGRLYFLLVLLSATGLLQAQETVFSDDFNISRGSTFSNVNGAIGTSPTWSLLRSGNDLGARIHNGVLTLTNDATGAGNVNGWVLAHTSLSNNAPYNPVLNSNAGLVTWTFNMRQQRSNPSGPANGFYANAFILAGSSNTTATSGTGYAVILGNNGKTDPLRLIRYTNGLRTSTNLLSSNTSGLNDFGNQYLSVRITYAPATNTWSMFVRQDSGSAFQDPLTGSLSFQGSVSDSNYTGTSLPLMGAFWNASTKKNQTATFDNVSVRVSVPSLAFLSPPTRIAGSAAFTLTVNGSNFSTNSVIRWNGSNRTTTYISPTQVSASIPATDIANAGTASVTVATNGYVSNGLTFTIDPAGVPVITVSTAMLGNMTTTTGTASAPQSFTVTGSSLTNNITVTAPTNFEVSTASGGPYQDNLVLTQSGGTVATQTLYTRLKASALPGTYSGADILASAGTVTREVEVMGTVLNSEPATSASSMLFTNIGASTATINWANGSGSARLVVLRQGAAVNSAPADGVSYTASAAFGSGSELGTGNYVVYAGSGSSVTVTGLNPNTAYHVAVYEYNGSGGTQNYKATAPLAGNFTTTNPPAGLQVTAANTVYTVTFDATLDGVNNSAFNGAGVSSAPQPGELNSNSFSITGFADGTVSFGGNSAEDTVFDSGQSDGGETDPGLYAFQVAPDNYALGIQPGAGNFSPGTVIFRFQNQTGAPITSLSIGYKVYVYNDEDGSNSFNFSHSSTNSNFIDVTALNHASGTAADAVPGWKAHYKSITITGLNIGNTGYYYLRWSGNAISGTAFDEIALDDLIVIANPSGNNFAPFNGTAETFVLAGNASLSGDTSVNNNITFTNSSRLITGANTLTLNGSVTNTSTGGLRGGASSNLIVGGAVNTTLSFDQTTPGTTNQFNNLTIASTGGNTITAGNNLAVSGSLNIAPDQILNIGTNTLTGALTSIDNNGTITTQNTTATPFATGKIWAGAGTVVLNASAQQTLVEGTYNNVTVSNAAGAVAGGNVTVNGNLNLPFANPSASTGSFSTGSHTLFMGPDGVNSGIGDVSGTVTRNTGIVANKLYTFGHADTSILLPPIGTLPTSMSLRIILNQAPADKADAILRTYDFIQTGGSDTKAVIRARYLDTELNGNNESRLVDWVVFPNTVPPSTLEQGRSNFSTTDNWVELSNVNLSFFTGVYGNELLTLAEAEGIYSVWNGSQSSSWVTAANWTPAGQPTFQSNVIIPDAATTPNDPILNVGDTEVESITIEAGGIVNSDTASNFRIFGTAGAWINNGTFNPGTGTVTFQTLDATVAGSTTFNNVTIASGASLRALEGNYMSIGGTLTKTGTLILGAFTNTVAYTGTNQQIVTPDGQLNSYNGLTISGTGAVLQPTLNVTGNLTTNAAVSFAGNTTNLLGLDNQVLGGTTPPAFNNLTVNKASGGVSLGANVAVNGTLTLTSGTIAIGESDLTLGDAAVAGSFSTDAMIVADGTGMLRRPYSAAGSYFFPIGENQGLPQYSPISVNITSGTFAGAYVGVNTSNAKHPDNNSTGNYLTRYWNVMQTGIAGAVATITAEYADEDIAGDEAAISAAGLNGVFDLENNPWEKFSLLSDNTLTAAGSVLTAGEQSAFTGITDQDVIVTVTGGGIFCEGDEVTLTGEASGGDMPYYYSWSGGLGNEAIALPPTTTEGTTVYTLTVRDANGIAATDTADVEVTEAPVAGSLSGSQGICSGTTPVAIVLTGNTGNIVRWESSQSLGFEESQFIPNTTNTLTGEELGNIPVTTYVRAVVQSGSCDEVYTAPVSIDVVTTVWDGAVWSNGDPDVNIAAVFEADYMEVGDIDACSILVTGGANVTIPSGYNVRVNGAVNVLDGTFTLEDNANLLQDNPSPTINSGEIRVEKNSNPLYRLDYTMWSSPVSGQNLQAFSPLTIANRFYEYDAFEDKFMPVDPANDFETGQGYLIRVPNNWPDYVDDETPGQVWPGIFTGVPNNGTVLVDISAAGRRFNSVGNPYPSPINVHNFFDDNINTLDPLSAIYFWRKRNNPDESSYATLTKFAYAENSAPGGDTSNGVFDDTDAADEWVINSGQGFIVRAAVDNTSGLVFNNDMRRAVNNNQFFRMGRDNGGEPDASRFWLNITGEQSGRVSQTVIGYSSYTTMGIDYGYDGRSAGDGAVSVYSTQDDVKFAIQARSAFDVNDVVVVGLKVEHAGTYSMSLNQLDGLFAQGQDIYVIDALTETTHNLKEGTYIFTSEAGEYNDRFTIVYTTGGLNTQNPIWNAKEIIVYKKESVIHIEAGTTIINDITVYDIMGRQLYNASGINAASFAIDSLQAEEQMLIINVGTDKGRASKKIIF